MPAPATSLDEFGGFDGVCSRLQSAAGLKHTDRAICEALGLSGAAFSARRRTSSLPLAEIILYCARQGIDLNVVLLGKTPTPRATAPLPAAHLAMRESALRTLSAALDTLETLHAYEKQGLENGPQS